MPSSRPAPASRRTLEHEGWWSARRDPYRIIYEPVEEERLVRVVALGIAEMSAGHVESAGVLARSSVAVRSSCATAVSIWVLPASPVTPMNRSCSSASDSRRCVRAPAHGTARSVVSDAHRFHDGWA